MRTTTFVLACSLVVIACSSKGGSSDETDAPAVTGTPTAPTGVGDPAKAPDAPKTDDGGACVDGSTCASGVCTNAVCAAPSATDGVKNGDESDIDCGGATAPKCLAKQACNTGDDCANGACPGSTCSEAPSCGKKAGGATCGAGEVGDPNAKHEDCCATAIVPRDAAKGGPIKMDKYLITAGRMRTFLESVNYDAKGWVAGHRPAWWTGTGTKTWDAMLPSTKDEFLNMTIMDGASGCWVGPNAGQNGAPAYWASADDLAKSVSGAARTYTQDEMDTKVMNCFHAPLFHALCAFDGGRLQTRDEWIAARTENGVVRKYPWGENGTDADRKARADYNFDYAWPREPVAGDHDLGGYLPSPGRFPLGYGPYGHADLLGSVEQMGVKLDASGAATGDGWFQFSFQEPEISAHPYGSVNAGFGSGAYRPHWAVGGRCVHPN